MEVEVEQAQATRRDAPIIVIVSVINDTQVAVLGIISGANSGSVFDHRRMTNNTIDGVLYRMSGFNLADMTRRPIVN